MARNDDYDDYDDEDYVDEPRRRPRRSSDDRNVAVLCHVGGIFFGFLCPLTIWLLKRDESKLLDYHGKEALNFQISMAIYILATLPIVLVTCGVGIVITIAVAIAGMILSIIAAVQCSNGERVRYPLNIRLIK